MKKIDIHNEMLILPYRNGVKLVRPDEVKSQDLLCNSSIISLEKFPVNVFVFDKQNVIQYANTTQVEACGVDSTKSLFGKVHISDFPGVKNDTAIDVARNNLTVVGNHKSIIVDEELLYERFPEYLSLGLSVKIPLYDASEKKVAGMFGMTALFSKHSMADLLKLILQLKLSNVLVSQESPSTVGLPLPGIQIHGVYLSQRQKECLKWLVRGKTAKQIAKLLNLSYRTVETHLENIKFKMGVYSRSELIDIVIEDILNIL